MNYLYLFPLGLFSALLGYICCISNEVNGKKLKRNIHWMLITPFGIALLFINDKMSRNYILVGMLGVIVGALIKEIILTIKKCKIYCKKHTDK